MPRRQSAQYLRISKVIFNPVVVWGLALPPSFTQMPMHRGTVDIAYQERKLDAGVMIDGCIYRCTTPAVIRGAVAIVRDMNTETLSAYFIPTGHFIFVLPQKWFLPCLREIEQIEPGLEHLTPDDVAHSSSRYTLLIERDDRLKEMEFYPDDYC
jgi:hypothetical protein